MLLTKKYLSNTYILWNGLYRIYDLIPSVVQVVLRIGRFFVVHQNPVEWINNSCVGPPHVNLPYFLKPHLSGGVKSV